jgi:hypothetical protein
LFFSFVREEVSLVNPVGRAKAVYKGVVTIEMSKHTVTYYPFTNIYPLIPMWMRHIDAAIFENTGSDIL